MTTTFATALTDVFSVFGENATFTSSTGSTSSVVVIYYEDLANQPGGLNAQMPAPDRAIEYIKNDIGRQTSRDESFTINGTSYFCQHVLEDDGYTITVAVRS